MNAPAEATAPVEPIQFLPERHTDFIFAVIGERFGFIERVRFVPLRPAYLENAACLTLSKNLYGTHIAGGIAAVMLMFQILVNVGMTIGIMPVTGITLPGRLGARRCWSPCSDRSPAEHPFASAAGLPQQGTNTTVALSRRAHPHHNPPDRSRAPRLSGRVVLRGSRKGKS